MAGLACARRLVAKGAEVSVFDKGRGPGGRMSTRRVDTPLGQLRFDHGCQYFTADDPAFRTVVKALCRDGHAAQWHGRILKVDDANQVTDAEDKPRFVGVPGMNSVIRAMADGLDVHFGTRIESLSRQESGWTLGVEAGEAPAHTYDAVVVATPAEQAEPLLLGRSPEMAGRAARVVSVPNWTVMLAFDAPLTLDWNGARFAQGDIGWAARNSSKPERDAAETWVLQARPEWSLQHLELEPDIVADMLSESFLNRFAEKMPEPPETVFRSAHRWRYAFVPEAEKVNGFDWDPALQLGSCGDWHLGPRVELAWLSGDRLGAAMG